MSASAESGSGLSLLSAEQVREQLGQFKILDASFHLPNSGRSVLDEYRNGPRLPGARLFDHEAIADTAYTIDGQTKLAHMQPDLLTFRRSMEKLGITRDDHLLVYDSAGIFSSPRAAWLLKSYGHPNVAVLDGGLPGWINKNYPVESAGQPAKEPSPSVYQIGQDIEAESRAREKVIAYEALVQNFDAPPAQRLAVFDARPQGRFLGIDPEPRPGLSSGHMPHAVSMPFTCLLTEPQGGFRRYLPVDQLERVFLERLGHDHGLWEEIKSGQRGLVVTCGSGMTACIIWFALHLCGGKLDRVRLFDESWTGYGLRKNSVIVKSSAP